jgi:isopenicillin N synthase-like dioxygenase
VSARSSLPVLDISGFRSEPDGPAGAAFVDALRDAFHGIGAAYLVGHGVSDDLVARVRRVAETFFALGEEERLAIENVHSPHFRGYTRLGTEHTNGRRDLRDQVDVGREQAAPEIGPDDPAWLRLRGPNLWPEGLPEFREAVSEYNAAVEEAGHALMRAVSLALGQPIDHFDAMVATPEVLTKIIRYPAPSEDFPSDQGVGAHTDAGFLTLLQQQDGVGGFEAEVYGEWVAVPALPGSFVVNIGELLQLVSNGYFRATLHRVVSPPKGVQRISIAYFFNPAFEAKIEPVTLPGALAAEAPGGASADPDNPILSSYGFNTLKVRLRAHPDVAERHHADLLARTD